ncbi:hemerythrin-like protein [Ceratobasidium sp. AG-Ba]|nr:hemerythrin-like protein [Ceratobasidium sp. AG-Ba]QRW07018.1 hemerythrin-like protein [Ceratobasidium sp. AG-Ba]
MLARFTRSSFVLRSTAPPRLTTLPHLHPRTFASTTSMASLDYYNEILVDHNNVRDLHQRFTQAYKNKDEKLMNDIANTIVHEAALHSDGEELSIYKVLDKHGLHDAAEKDREEHQQVKQAMSHVDSSSISSLGIDGYAAAVEKACKLFLQHAEDEENVQYKQLSAKLTSEDKASLAKDFLKARAMAPSRPHPSAPQDGGVGQKLMGTMAKPVDAAVSAARNFVDLKYQHADPKAA